MIQRSLVVVLGLLLMAACAAPPPPPPPDYAAEHKPVLDAFMAGWNAGDLDGLDQAVTSDYVRTSPGGMTVNGLDGLKKLMGDLRASYPDMQVVLDESHFMRDVSFHRWTFSGTNTGPGEEPPTGKSVTLPGLTLLRYRDGKIAEEIVEFDSLAWKQQLGYTVVPPAGQ